MADKKVTELASLSTPAGEDVIYIIDDPSGTPVSKKISLATLLGAVPSPTTFSASVTLNNKVTAANGVMTLATSKSVSTNNASTLLGSGMQGSIFWDENYLYVATSNTQIKRVGLSSFTP